MYVITSELAIIQKYGQRVFYGGEQDCRCEYIARVAVEYEQASIQENAEDEKMAGAEG